MRKLMRVISILFLVAIIGFIITFGLMSLDIIENPFSKKPDDLVISQSEIRLKRNKKFQLSVKVLPDNSHDKKVIFESSKPDIVSVNEITGYLEAKKNGIVTITAYLDKYKDIKSECLVIVSDNDVRIEKIILNTKKVNLQVGKEYKINYKIEPKEATLHEIEYMTSDPKVAMVDENGNIKGIGTGTSIVVVSDKVSGVYEEVEVSVYEGSNGENPKSLKLSPKNMTISVGGSSQIEATISPKDSNSDITYESMDSNIAMVSDTGEVTGKKEGTTKILGTTINGIEDYITVKVTSNTVKVTGVEITDKSITMNLGDSKKLSYKIKPSNATNQGVKITSSNENIVKIDGTKLIAINSGSVDINVITNDGGYKDSVKVEVNKVNNIIPESNITLSKNSVDVVVGGSVTIKANVVPSNATYKSLLWTSENSSIATVSDGLIVGKNVGKTNIIVKSVYKNISKKISVNVREQAVQSISLDKKNATLIKGDKLTLVKTISPNNATNKSVSWESNNPGIATVDSKGVVTGVSEGTAVIKVTTANGKSDSCTIIVKADSIPVTGVSLDKQTVKTTINSKVYLTATIAPSNATNKKITWTSNNPNVAKVSDGVVETVGVGTALITAKTNNGKKATCEVIVTGNNNNVDVTKVELDKTSLSLKVGQSDTIHVTVKPDNATNKSITWTSSDNSIATVNNGNITAKGVGNATITAKATNGIKATCKVTVSSNSSSSTTVVTGITLDPSSKTIGKGEKLTIVAQISPSGVSDKLTWTSSKPEVASVDSNGVVTGIKGGTTNIKATTSNGITAVSVITVKGVPTPTITLTPKVAEYTGEAIPANKATSNISGATIKYTYYTNSSCSKKTTSANGAAGDGKAPSYVGNYYVKATIEKTSTYNASESECIKHTITKVSNINAAFYNGTTINNTFFGITKGKDVTRSVAEKNRIAINKAIEYAWNNGIQEISLVKNDYVIDVEPNGTHKGIKITHPNINLNLSGAEIRLFQNNYAKYIVVYIANADNSNVYNGAIIGDKGKHTCTNSGKLLADTYPACPDAGEPSATHQMGYGVMIINSNNIKLHDLKIHAMTGDGIIIEDSLTNDKFLTNTIKIYKNEIYNNRRQGISVICGNDIEIYENYIHHIKGNDPQAGIDLEQDTKYQKIANVKIHDNEIKNVAGASVTFGVCPNRLSIITIEDNINDKGIRYCNEVSGLSIKGNTKDSENTLHCVHFTNKSSDCNV